MVFRQLSNCVVKRCPVLVIALLLVVSSDLLPQTAPTNQCGNVAEAVSLCTVLSNPSRYDDREITVRGRYRMVFHGSVLMSADCPATLVNLRQANDYKSNPNSDKVVRSIIKHDQYQPVDVVMRGNFHVAQQGQCFGQNCLMYEFEDHELLCAAKPNSTGR